MRIVSRILLAIVLIVLPSWSVYRMTREVSAAQTPGGPLGDIKVVSYSGLISEVRNLRGQVVVLDVWAEY